MVYCCIGNHSLSLSLLPPHPQEKDGGGGVARGGRAGSDGRAGTEGQKGVGGCWTQSKIVKQNCSPDFQKWRFENRFSYDFALRFCIYDFAGHFGVISKS